MKNVDRYFPPIVWLKVTDYMHGWVEWELCGSLHVRDKRVVCVQTLDGARSILRKETVEETVPNGKIGVSMSCTCRNAIDAGMSIDRDVMEHEYGVTEEILNLYMPIECPKRCMTSNGVLRPWTFDVNFGEEQASAMQRLLRNSFWKAVEEYSALYAVKHSGEKYAQVDMIEDFCSDTETPDMYVEAIRREWQRRVKRAYSSP